MDWLFESVDEFCDGTRAWKIILSTIVTTVAALWTYSFMFQDKPLYDRAKSFIFKIVRKIPAVERKIATELAKVSSGIQKDMNDGINCDPYLKELPRSGWDNDKVIEEVTKYANYGHCRWEDGFASGTVYNGDPILSKLMAEVYGLHLWSNPLHADVFPGIRKMEAEVVRMCCNLFNGGSESCGTMTTGGTESIILACKAYVTYARDVKGIKNPEMLIPVTAHAAFDKGAALLGIPIKHAPVDPITMKVDIKKMKSMITKRTCMIVGSSPQFPHGVIDPIEELSEIAVKYNIPLHVDACLGGFLIPFMEEAGYPLALFDFRLKGVTSISCDTHKYGYSPKGSSVILYRNKELRYQQFFVQPDWPGGIYATPALSGSRPGGIIAATWASLIYHGRDGYVKFTRDIIRTAKEIERDIRSIPSMVIMGRPDASVVSFTSHEFNVYDLSDRLTKKGWNLNALQFPSCIHIAVTVLHTKEGVAKRLVNDVQEISKDLRKNPPKEVGGSAAMYGMAQSIPDRSIISDIAWAYLDSTLNTEYSNRNTTTNGVGK